MHAVYVVAYYHQQHSYNGRSMCSECSLWTVYISVLFRRSPTIHADSKMPCGPPGQANSEEESRRPIVSMYMEVCYVHGGLSIKVYKGIVA